MLIAPEALAERLDEFRSFDATVALDRPPEVARTWRGRGARTISPGTSRARRSPTCVHDFADPDAPFPFAVPSAERFAAVAGAHGIGPGV